VLAGLCPVDGTAGPGPGSWDQELDARTACPAHRARLSAAGLRRGAIYEPAPDGWTERADLGTVPATIVLFLERLRLGSSLLGSGLPRIAVHEGTDLAPASDPARA